MLLAAFVVALNVLLLFALSKKIQVFFSISVGYHCMLNLPQTHTQTHNHISVVFQNHVSALCNIILFYISLFYIEKKGLQTAILYGGNLSLCGPQNSNKVFLFLLSLAFSFHFLIFIWFYYFHSCEFVLEHIVANKKKSLLPKDIWFNCYVFF